MIVVPLPDHLRLVEQDHHAHLTGDLAALMPPGDLDHAAFVAAARVHDNGWREHDAAPTLDGSGLPHTFSSVDDGAYEAIWRRGIDRAVDLDPLIGLLVSLHGARFFGPRTSQGMRALAADSHRRQTDLLHRLGFDGGADDLPAPVRQASDRIAFADTLSLLLCGALPDRLTAAMDGVEHRLTRTGATVTVQPWPFHSQATTLRVPIRKLPHGPYASQAQLRGAFAAAEGAVLEVRIA